MTVKAWLAQRKRRRLVALARNQALYPDRSLRLCSQCKCRLATQTIRRFAHAVGPDLTDAESWLAVCADSGGELEFERRALAFSFGRRLSV